MATLDETKPPVTNESTDPALINTEPDLTVIRQDRRTDCGFLIEETRLPRCVPLPANKVSRRSWVWEHGVLIGRLNHQGEPVPCWLCTSCYHEPRSSRPSDLSAYLIKATTATNRIIDHLVDRHYYGRKGEPPESYKSKKRKHNTLEEAWMNAEHAHKEVFNTSGWKAAYCKWVACSGVSLRQATSKELVSLLTYQHPKLSSMPITSATTAGMWMKQCFDHNKDKVKQSLATAKSGLTISFDGWKANNDVLDLLGVVAHFIDSDYKLRTIVIGLRNTYGSHTGANIAQHLFEVLHDYQIRGSQVAYFASDNASNNHTALQKLQPKITSLDPLTSRLRCAGHIYNLVCNAILYGFNEDAFADASQVTGEGDFDTVTNFNAVLHTADDEAKLHAWRKKGPVGRLHNTMIHINTNSKRRGLFESRQREVIDEAGGDPLNTRIYRAIVNGGIRWNSTYLMIKRAMLLRDAIHNYQDDPESEFDHADYLTQQDWLQLREMLALLQPLFEASERVQSQGTTHTEHCTTFSPLWTIALLTSRLRRTSSRIPIRSRGVRVSILAGKSSISTTQ